MQPAGRAVVEAAKADGRWTLVDDAEAGVEHPLLTAALGAAPAARASWDGLPPSARKQALMQIALARTDATKEKRVAAIVAACAAGRRPMLSCPPRCSAVPSLAACPLPSNLAAAPCVLIW